MVAGVSSNIKVYNDAMDMFGHSKLNQMTLFYDQQVPISYYAHKAPPLIKMKVPLSGNFSIKVFFRPYPTLVTLSCSIGFVFITFSLKPVPS